MKGLTLNTLISATGVIGIGIIAYFSKHSLEGIEGELKSIHTEIVPRVEHEARWDAERQRFIRIETDLADVRTRLVELEKDRSRR